MNHARSILSTVPEPSPEKPTHRASWYTPGLADGLGDRLLMFDNTSATSLELLRFKREFSDAPEFERALRQRLKQLERFAHPLIAKARSVEWLEDGEGLALVSNHTVGRRLSELLSTIRGVTLAAELVQQLTPVLASLHEQGVDVAHGVLTPERIIVTPGGGLMMVEHVIGPALEALHLPARRLQELGLAVTNGREDAALDRRSDVVQLAFMATSLLLGRRIDPAEYQARGAALLEDFSWTGPNGAAAPAQLRAWLTRALALGGPAALSARDSHAALLDLLTPGALAMPSPSHRDDGDDALPADGPRSLSPAVIDYPRPKIVGSADGSTGALVPASDQSDFLSEDDVESSFPSEDPIPAAKPVQKPVVGARPVPWITVGLAALVVAQAVAIAGFATGRLGRPAPAASGAGAAVTPLLVESPEPGAEVLVDGRKVGVTPMTLDVSAATKSIRIVSAAVGGVAAPVAGTAATTGQLLITSDPAGARVTIDGARRGVTPLNVPVAAGAHSVQITDGTSTTTRNVEVTAGVTATMMASFAPAGSTAGWLTLTTPLEVQVLEGGTLLGTSAARLMLPAGRHDLELTNTTVGFRTTLSVDIPGNKTIASTVAVPNGTVSINALPWANVFLDGRPLGSTPIANLDVPLGTHEVVWRHPQLGERRQTIVVTARSPVRTVMDFNK